MYTVENFKTKKELKEALAKAPQSLQQPFIGDIPDNGTVYIEGPHGYHKWYAQGYTIDGRLVSIK